MPYQPYTATNRKQLQAPKTHVTSLLIRTKTKTQYIHNPILPADLHQVLVSLSLA
jgi:hypothetical protein